VLDVLVAEIGQQRAGVVALVGQREQQLFQVGELIRNELDNDRDAWRSQAGCASWSADLLSACRSSS
jgi:hypothetical protein